MWFHKAADAVTGRNRDAWKQGRLRGAGVMMSKNVLDLNDYAAHALDSLAEVILGRYISFALVSATVADSATGKGKVGPKAHLEEWQATATSLVAGESPFKVTFQWDESFGIPGALIVRSCHNSEFFLKTLAVDGVPGKGRVVFVCNSWVYPAGSYHYDRVFFTNDTYLPSELPAPLRPYRDEEFRHLRGDDVERKLEEHDRVYRYAVYNDLGAPDKGPEYVRKILGGSSDFPYPRRGHTGRHATRTDPNSESRLWLLDLNIYVPRDERFGHLKMSDFLGFNLKALAEDIIPLVRATADLTPNEFDSFEDIRKLYDYGLKLPDTPEFREARRKVPLELIKDLLPNPGDQLLKFPTPQLIKVDGEINDRAWRTDEEFAREMLAGMNPVVISRLKVFPPRSELDPKLYGDHTSRIVAADIEKNMGGMKVHQALRENRLYILDHHDHFMPYLNRINALRGNFVYATRTLLFLNDDGTLKPLCIELSLPHPDGEQHGAVSKVYTPSETGVEASLWLLAKAYVCVNDAGYHQLISHWLNTHATIEPFVIATHRQLSVTHPVHKLLSPHFRDTMNINALARQLLINAGGILESTFFPRKYAMEMSSVLYKSWKLTELSLPDELIKRGVAAEDPTSPYKVRLLIKHYPYAVDGLQIWWAIERWVNKYISIYYSDDRTVREDTELQAWWKEVREEGHGDKKDEPWWPTMQTVAELRKTCATLIWVASALHAAVNFGQYAYSGYFPNRPTVSRRPMPEPGTEAYAELERDPDTVYLRTITSQIQTILGITVVEVLAKHSSDEVYLGQRDTPEWTSDRRALEAFEWFGGRLREVEKLIEERNGDPEKYKNRSGPVKLPYMLLFPNTSGRPEAEGLSAMGIPNSVSI